MIHQLLLAHGPSLMHHQVFEYPHFLAGQRQRLPVDGGGAGAGIKGQVSTGQQHVLLVMVVLLPAFLVNDVGMGDPFFCKYLCPQGEMCIRDRW